MGRDWNLFNAQYVFQSITLLSLCQIFHPRSRTKFRPGSQPERGSPGCLQPLGAADRGDSTKLNGRFTNGRADADFAVSLD